MLKRITPTHTGVPTSSCYAMNKCFKCHETKGVNFNPDNNANKRRTRNLWGGSAITPGKRYSQIMWHASNKANNDDDVSC